MLTGLNFFYSILKHNSEFAVNFCWKCHNTQMPRYSNLWFTINHNTCSNYHLFSDIAIAQGSVATCLRCGGIFSYYFTANLSPSLTVKEFWKSVKVWQSYCYEFGGPLFLWNTVYMSVHICVCMCVCVPTGFRYTTFKLTSTVFHIKYKLSGIQIWARITGKVCKPVVFRANCKIINVRLIVSAICIFTTHQIPRVFQQKLSRFNIIFGKHAIACTCWQ